MSVTSVVVDIRANLGERKNQRGYAVVVIRPDMTQTTVSEHPWVKVTQWDLARVAATGEAHRLADAFGVKCWEPPMEELLKSLYGEPTVT